MFRSKARAAAKLPTVSKADAARAGADGDGLEHDLEYWIKSGFLTLPRKDERQAEADAAHAAATSAADPADTSAADPATATSSDGPATRDGRPAPA